MTTMHTSVNPADIKVVDLYRVNIPESPKLATPEITGCTQWMDAVRQYHGKVIEVAPWGWGSSDQDIFHDERDQRIAALEASLASERQNSRLAHENLKLATGAHADAERSLYGRLRDAEQSNQRLRNINNSLRSTKDRHSKRADTYRDELNQKCVVIGRLHSQAKTARAETQLAAFNVERLMHENRTLREALRANRSPFHKLGEIAAESVGYVAGGVSGMARGSASLAKRAVGSLLGLPGAALGAVACSWRNTRVIDATARGLTLASILVATPTTCYMGYQEAREHFALATETPAPANPNDPRERAWLAARHAVSTDSK